MTWTTTSPTPTERFRALLAVEALLAKATGIRELSQMARLETRLRQLYMAEWNRNARRAVKAAVSMAEHGGNAKVVEDVVDREMGRWARVVEPFAEQVVERMYYLSRSATARKIQTESKEPLTYDLPAREPVEKAAKKPAAVSLAPSFDVADEAAAKALQRNTLFWTGSHYSDNVAKSVRDTVRETMVEAGQDRVAAGRLLQQRLRETLGTVTAPSGWKGTQAQYFEGLAANAATTARAAGTLRTLADLGVTHYQISNPIDDRTCDVCGHLNDKEFLVEHGQQVLDKELAARTPEQAKAAHPWLSYSKLLELAPKAGATNGRDSDALAKQGFVMPPFHFRCRCSVDISFSGGGVADISNLGAVAAKPKAPQAKYPKWPGKPSKPSAPKLRRAVGTAADQAMAQMVPELSPAAQAELRSQLNAVVGQEGMTSQDVLARKKGAGKVKINSAALEKNGAAGIHDWDGTMHLDLDHLNGAAAFLKRGGSSKVGMDEFSTLIHETVHSCGPVGKGAFQGAMAMAEEATTELATVRLLMNQYPKQGAKLWWNGRSYKDFIKWFEGRVKESMEFAEIMTYKEQAGKMKKVWEQLRKATARKLGGMSLEASMGADASIKFRSVPKAAHYNTKQKAARMLAESFELPSEVSKYMTAKEQQSWLEAFRSYLELTLSRNQ